MLVSRGGNERAQASAVDRRAVEFFGCGFLVRRLFRSVRWPPSVGCSLPVSQFGPGLWRSLVPRAGNPPKSGRKARESERGQASPRAALPWEEPRGGRKEGRQRQAEGRKGRGPACRAAGSRTQKGRGRPRRVPPSRGKEKGDPELACRGGGAAFSLSHRSHSHAGAPTRSTVALLGRVGEASRRAGSIPLPVSFGAAWGGPVFRQGRAPLGGRCPRTPTRTCACGLSAAPGWKGSCLPPPSLLLYLTAPLPLPSPPCSPLLSVDR